MTEHQHTDLDEVKARIDEAQDAEDRLRHTMPNATVPDDDAYEGMSGPTEGDVDEAKPEAKTDDEVQAEAPRTPTEQVEEGVLEDR